MRARYQEEKQPSYVLRVLVIILVSLCIGSVIGVIQNHYNEPLRGCTQFRTFTQYKGYTCSDGTTRWLPPQSGTIK